jgi:hypothetical protein
LEEADIVGWGDVSRVSDIERFLLLIVVNIITESSHCF